jgi:hypothetical protein
MAYVTESEYGTDSVTINRVTDANMFMEQFAEFNARVPTNALSRLYYPIFIPQATQAVGSYTVGICPFASTLVAVRHICKTVTAAGTVEVESSSSASCMTADDAAETLQSATLATAVADRLFDQGDSILVKIATASADLLHLSILLVLQPIW